ncbi:MHYT domain-containing protein [Legionella sp. km772]|uniref:MHYT domain-containing protein n=1 Tax=Legionella sp. km772 TaxID=2498111 RepID=UPI00131513E9|nr:MHYT domain-containing protein [Legionella sp. km772]
MSISMNIRYVPSIFLISIFIAIFASEAALYLAIKVADPQIKHPFMLKIFSALLMGAAICGMHYTGMAAAVFTPLETMPAMGYTESPDNISVMIAMVTIFILGIAIVISSAKDALAVRHAKMARLSGMAEVASSVLHNVGNALNSVNVSASLIKNHLRNIELDKLQQLNGLIHEHQDDLASFFTTNPKGVRVPNYLDKLATIWREEYKFLQEELERLDHNIRHIKDIISVQQSLSVKVNFVELTSLESAIDNALTLTGIDFAAFNITIKSEHQKLKPICLDQLKLSQVLVNLITHVTHGQF